jgi:hypothetical protein
MTKRFVRGHLYHMTVKNPDGSLRERLVQFLANCDNQYDFQQLASNVSAMSGVSIHVCSMSKWDVTEITENELPKFVYLEYITPLYEKILSGFRKPLEGRHMPRPGLKSRCGTKWTRKTA